jgi:carbon monoxide dehydrogenase subunit G
MLLSGETEIAASRKRVWDVLTDPGRVAECVPGEPNIEVVDERNFRVTAQVGNRFFRTTVTIEIELTDLSEPERASANATAAVMASPVTANGTLELEELAPNLTRASWSAEATLSGRLIGFAGMVQAPAQSAIDRTLECLKARIEAETQAMGAG